LTFDPFSPHKITTTYADSDDNHNIFQNPVSALPLNPKINLNDSSANQKLKFPQESSSMNHHKIEENIHKDNEQRKLLFSDSEIFNDLSEIEQFNEAEP
jgi:hypothetical protein